MQDLELIYSLFNPFMFQDGKNQIENLEYYFSTHISSQGNVLIQEFIKAIKTYNYDAIGEPLFQSILSRSNKTPMECSKIMNDLRRWTSYSKTEIEPARKALQDICAKAIIMQAEKYYNNHPSEYLKFLKNVNFQTSDPTIFSTKSFNELDIKSIISETENDFVQSKYDWINKSFYPHPGYEKGQMVLVCAAPGVGKSLFMMNEALHMAISGHKVTYIALGDLNIKDFIVRMGAMFSGLSFANTYKNIEGIYYEMCKLLGQNLNISISPAGIVSADDIVEKYKDSEEEVIFIDYDGNLKGAAEGESMYSSYGLVYERLNEMVLAGKLVFLACQPKVTAWSNATIELQDIGESSRKQHTADIIIGLGREVNSPNHLGTFKISKSRRGEEGVKSYSIRLNNGRFYEIPKGVFDLLKQEIEKKDYSEGDIRVMVEQYAIQFSKTPAGQGYGLSRTPIQQPQGPQYTPNPFTQR